jgi:hypothetical protein
MKWNFSMFRTDSIFHWDLCFIINWYCPKSNDTKIPDFCVWLPWKTLNSFMVMLKYLKETTHFGDGDHRLLGFCHTWHLILNPIIFSCSSTSLLNFEHPYQHPSISIFEHFCWFRDDVQFSFFTSISGISWRCKQRTGSLANNISNHYKAIFIIFLGVVLIISLIA